MNDYVPYEKIPAMLGINKGDILYIASDILDLSKAARINGEKFDCAKFIRLFQEEVGEQGTLIFPTFTWEYCDNNLFNYRKTRGKTGALGNAALSLPEFRRTLHPIYSFAVWGRDADSICGMENTAAFGLDSPFAWLHKNHATNLLIGVDMQHSFTFTHYVEAQCNVPYRFEKDFTSTYIDNEGLSSMRTYSMYVRNLDLDVTVNFDPLEKQLQESGISRVLELNRVTFQRIDLYAAYGVIESDIKTNRAKKLCSYKGQ